MAIEKDIGDTIGQVGPSMALTSLSEICCFGIGMYHVIFNLFCFGFGNVLLYKYYYIR